MSIPTILRGDTPSPISIRMPDGFPSGSDLILVYQGVERAYANINPGDVLTFALTRQEVAGMSIGTRAVRAYVRYADGDVLTVPSDDIRIKVTDCAGEVYGGSLSLPDMPGSMPDDATDGDSLADLKAKFNALKRVVTTSCIAAAAALFGSGIEPGTTLNDIPGTATVGEIVGSAVPDWAKQPNPPKTGAVDSVNGKTGTVSLAAADVGALSTEGGTVKGTIVMYTDYAPAIMQIGAGGYGGILEVYSGADQPASIQKDGQEVATEFQVAAVSNRVDALGSTVNAWQTYWDGDDVRLTVTNYYGSLDIPSLFLEHKMPADDDHDSPWFRVVWDERTRWNKFLSCYADVTNDVAQNKADRAWGVYDSSTGAYSPDGLLQLSQECIMIAAGMSWQKTVTTGGGSVWILTSTIPFVMSGETTNGFFRIEDGDGHALFEIVKGDKKVVPATPTSVVNSLDGFSVGFSVDSSAYQHPVGEVALNVHGPYVPEDSLDGLSVTWNGDSGNWIATISATPPHVMPKIMFFRATYETGGNTFIKNNVATSIDRVVIGGIEYAVTVETINGKKLMVLK